MIKWYYNDSASQIIPTLVHIITNKQIDTYLNIKLFKPLDIKILWNKDKFGNCYGPNGLCITTDNLCKIGLFFINKGKWKNKQILSKKLINELIKKRINKKQIIHHPNFTRFEGIGYAYLIWIYKDQYCMSGFLGEMLFINPKKKIVASRLIHPKWNNKKFCKEQNSDNIHFRNFKKLIKKL